MDNKKIPHGIEALREMLIQFDELGYQPTVPVAIGAEEHAKEFKLRLAGAIDGYVRRELMNFACDIVEHFELQGFSDYALKYQERYSFSYDLIVSDAKRDMGIEQLLHDLYDITEGKELCWCCVAEALYDAGWRKQEVNHEAEK